MSTLKDLNKHLFDQLDRLAKADKEGLEIEIDRAQVMVEISAEILKTNKLIHFLIRNIDLFECFKYQIAKISVKIFFDINYFR